MDILLIKRSTANSGGTPTNPAIMQHDSNDAAVTAVVSTYAANPTGGYGECGTCAGISYGGAGAAGVIVWDFTTRNSKGIVLRGVAQSLNLNFNGQAVPSGMSADVDVEWSGRNNSTMLILLLLAVIESVIIIVK